ncbi:MAG: site-2 protease family protein [Lachnospiraceae bacterium]|nr:site-2 protease family protein [Lachnospiraceae bacterium]
MLISIIWFILILSVVVVAHEFGHYLIARLNNIHVVEFSVGMGPTIFHFDKGETRYSLKLLPLGGSCAFEGEDGKVTGDKPFKGLAFPAAPVWARIGTVFAGPFFNFILAFIFAMVIVSYCGTDIPKVQGLTEGRPAAESGLEVGDIITAINGEKIHLWRDITLISYLNTGEELTVEYKRDGVKGTVKFTPAYSAEDGRYFLGIEGGTTYEEAKGLKLFKASYYEIVFNFRNTVKSLKQLIIGKLSPKNLSGPVGIAQVVSDNYEQAKDYGVSSVILTMMNIALLLSVNLGVINLLPLPALDGGRLIFLFVEVVRGKPIPVEKEGIVHTIGIILFFILAIFVMFNDIMRIMGR